MCGCVGVCLHVRFLVFVLRASVDVHSLRGTELIKAGMKVGDSKKNGEHAERGDVTSPAAL